MTGWLRFAGMKEKVVLDLKGDFHRDVHGTKLRLKGDGIESRKAGAYMKGLALVQTGDAGDITAGLMPRDYVEYPYIEWYSERNGRVVLELEPGQIEVIGTPVPLGLDEPVSRDRQRALFGKFLGGMAGSLRR